MKNKIFDRLYLLSKFYHNTATIQEIWEFLGDGDIEVGANWDNQDIVVDFNKTLNLKTWEHNLIVRAMKMTKTDKEAAELLGISDRAFNYRKNTVYKISRKKI